MKHTTKFQNKVYEIVKKIPRGKVMTYKEIAKAINRPRACRVIGNVLNKNIDPTVPCHRVIRSDGLMGGFKEGTKKKIELLKNEKVF